MAKHLEKFIAPFRQSRIPFLLAEVVTNGSGEMVDLVCRFANAPAARLLGLPAENLQNQRFTRRFPSLPLADFAPVQQVAFSGSAASFFHTAVTGAQLTLTCYQALYGVVGCLLEPRAESGREDPVSLLAETLPGAVAVLELGRAGLRCLSFSQRLCELVGWSRKELLDQFSSAFSALVDPVDWPGLLQELLDAARESRPVDHELRLLRREGPPLWVNLRAETRTDAGGAVFYAALLDIDEARRTQARLEETRCQLDAAQAQLGALFTHLPGSYCLLRLTDGGTEVVHLSPDLAALLGYSEADLARHLTSDPLWRVLSADRPALTAAAREARSQGLPLRHLCRVRNRSGGALWMSLAGVWQPQPTGETLLYAACTDVSAKLIAESSLRFRSQLCELLLDQSHIVTLEYAPAADTAIIEYEADGGQRASRTVERYLETLGTAQGLHPDDIRRFSAAFKRVLARPSTGTLEFRGDYDGRGWRWYRLSLLSLFDGGSVCRLLGKAEDISAEKAAAERFRELAARHCQRTGEALTSARLDLTDNRILDARGSSRHLVGVLFGNTAESCLRHVRDNIPDRDQQSQFDALFSRSALLDAFSRGDTHLDLEHRFTVEDGLQVWGRTTMELAKDPENQHVAVFCCTLPGAENRCQDAVLATLAQRDYTLVMTVATASGVCRSYSPQSPVPSGISYRVLAAAYLRQQTPSRQRSALRRALALDTVLARLETETDYLCNCPESGPWGAAQVRWAWLDRGAGVLLLTAKSLE